MDSMYNVMFLVDGVPASLIDVYEAIRKDPERLTLERNGARTQPTPKLDAGFLAMFRHLFYSTTTGIFDGYHLSAWGNRRLAYAHYAHPEIGPYPETAKQVSLAAAFVFSIAGLLSMLLAGVFYVFKNRKSPAGSPVQWEIENP
jgi:hypothetical protein